MSDMNGESPTVIGADANFKGELSFDKSVRIEGNFEGHIHSKGTLHIAEGAVVTANVEATNVKIEGACKGNLQVSEKLHMMASAKVEGDLRTSRLEIADGAIFVGNVVVGQSAGAGTSSSMSSSSFRPSSVSQPTPIPRETPRPVEDANRPKPQENRISAGS
ncbi:MAG: polymer-forming cytoskeletal protein [Phycisphaerales bacterium]|nr:polymer-forming cytoskeletal protein [Phycisphaerales bacterium]